MSEVLAQLEKKGSGDMSETVLWTNPTPSSTFGDSTITLSDDINNYKYLKIVWKKSTSNAEYITTIVSVDEFKTSTNAGAGSARYAFSFCSIYYKGTGSTNSGIRIFYYVTDTTIKMSQALGFNGSNVDNSVDIPYQVIGLK